jgi:hypothetical protein
MDKITQEFIDEVTPFEATTLMPRICFSLDPQDPSAVKHKKDVFQLAADHHITNRFWYFVFFINGRDLGPVFDTTNTESIFALVETLEKKDKNLYKLYDILYEFYHHCIINDVDNDDYDGYIEYYAELCKLLCGERKTLKAIFENPCYDGFIASCTRDDYKILDILLECFSP